MMYLEKAFLPLFIFIATVSGLAFGSVIPLLFLVVPVLVMPVLMYSYTRMYKYRYRLLTEDEPIIDLAHFSTQVVGLNDQRTFVKYSFDENYNMIHDGDEASVCQQQIADITSRQLPQLTDAMPSNGSATQNFTAVGNNQWTYRFHFKSVAAEFNAVGIGRQPKEAFAVAQQVLQRQIREWHISRETDQNYIGAANNEILLGIPELAEKAYTEAYADKKEEKSSIQNLAPQMGATAVSNTLQTTLQLNPGKQMPTVLIVEDDADVAMATESIFKQLGCRGPFSRIYATIEPSALRTRLG